MPQDEDTDTKIALLASLLEPTVFTKSNYLDALARASGDVSAAAEDLLLNGARPRKSQGSGLDTWLGREVKKRRIEGLSTPAVVESPETKTTSKPKLPVADLTTLLKDSSSKPAEKQKTAPLPAVNLSTPEQIARTVPCSLHTSPLPPALASSIYLTLMKLSDHWVKRSWYLAGRKVEAPHGNSFYARKNGGYGTPEGSAEKAKYYYAGIENTEADDFPDVLKQAADLVEPFVNEVLATRQRFPYEYAGPWRANVCGVNRYDGAASNVGWHSDTMAYLGPYTTIASLSLGTPRAFRLRATADGSQTKPIRTYEMTLKHNSICIMHAGCQERYKHTVPPQKSLDLFRPPFDINGHPVAPENATTYTSRINITFRFYRPDFHPLPGISYRGGPREGTPVCPCGIPTLLRADQKGKARANLARSPSKRKPAIEMTDGVVTDDMIHFWQCQAAAQTGEIKGCGFFRILDAEAEGRGPFIKDRPTQQATRTSVAETADE